jgi:integrase
MASLSKNSKGNWRIQFLNGDKSRKTIWVGRVQERYARTVLRHVEELVEANDCRRPVVKETSVWLADADQSLLGKLAKVGLVEAVEVVTNPTLTDLAEGYLAQADIEDSTKSIRRYWLKSIIKILGDKTCDQYTIEDGNTLRDRLLSQGLAPDTVQRMLRFAQQLLLRAVPRFLRESPFAKLKMNHRENRMPNRDYISRDFFEEILAVLPGPWQMLVALGRLGGLRCPSEGLLVRWKDVNLDGVPGLDVTSPKTKSKGKPWRRIPICPRLVEILRSLKPKNCSAEDYLVNLPAYRTERERGWHGVNVRQQFTRHLEAGGIGKIKAAFKVFRSSCLTDWAKNHPIHVVAKWAGNTVAVIAKHYLTLVDHDWIKATTSTTTTPMPSNSTMGVVLDKTGEALTSTLTGTPAVNGGKVSEQNETKKIKSTSGEITLTVSQSVSHSGEEMGVLEENLTKTLNTDVVSRTELTASEPICPDIRIYPARIRT